MKRAVVPGVVVGAGVVEGEVEDVVVEVVCVCLNQYSRPTAYNMGKTHRAWRRTDGSARSLHELVSVMTNLVGKLTVDEVCNSQPLLPGEKSGKKTYSAGRSAGRSARSCRAGGRCAGRRRAGSGTRSLKVLE